MTHYPSCGRGDLKTLITQAALPRAEGEPNRPFVRMKLKGLFIPGSGMPK
jgi:hypothetical protein